MSLFNLFGSNQTGREEKIKKKMLLEFCTLDELVKVWKMYVSKSNPKFKYTDENGLTKFRETTRKEQEKWKQAIIETLITLERKYETSNYDPRINSFDW